MADMKSCARCCKALPLDAFHLSKRSSTGRVSWCKPCIREHRGQKERILEPISDRKTCSACGVVKMRDQFHGSGKNRQGITNACKDCLRAARGFKPRNPIIDGRKKCSGCAEWKLLDDYALRSDRQIGKRSKCKACESAESRIGGVQVWRHRRRRYGLSSTDYAKFVAVQGGHCGLCGGDPDRRGLVIDHDHETGAVRALLCNRCNSGIGMFGESEERLMLAIAYLRRFARAPVAE